MTKHIVLSLAIALGLAAVAAPSPAQEGPKLYVFTSGSLGGFPKAALQMGGQGNMDWVPVSFYVLKHPKGNVIIDTGNNDKTITDPEGWWGPLAKGFGIKMTKDDAIPAQLAKIGLKTDDIKYVVVGHLHLDHGGNVGQFPNSTLGAQEDELKAAWGPDVGGREAPKDGLGNPQKRCGLSQGNPRKKPHPADPGYAESGRRLSQLS